MNTTWIYIHSEHSSEHDLFTVGFYTPEGQFMPESDHSTREEASQRVHYLNGGREK